MIIKTMNVDVYIAGVYGGEGIWEVCRNCATSLHSKGYLIEYDRSLSKETTVVKGDVYYVEQPEDDCGMIKCSVCNGSLASELDPLPNSNSYEN